VRAFLAASLLFVLGCGGGSTEPTPDTGTPLPPKFTIQMDLPCQGMEMDIWIDDVLRGRYWIGQKVFTVSNGQHKATAQEIGGAGRRFESGYHTFDSGMTEGGGRWSVGYQWTIDCPT